MRTIRERQVSAMMMLVAMGQKDMEYREALEAVAQFRGLTPDLVENDIALLLAAAGMCESPKEWLETICEEMGVEDENALSTEE